MQLFGYNITKKNAHMDDARAKSLKVRQLKSEIDFKKLEIEMDKLKAKQETAKEQSPMIQAFMDNPEQAFIMIMLEKFMESKTKNITSSSGVASPLAASEVYTQLNFSEEQIKEMINEISPRARNALKKMDDEQVKKMVIQYMPTISEDSLILAVQEIKK